MAGRLAEADVARDDRPKHFFLEELPHVGRDLLAEVGALVEHREQHAFDVELRVQRRAHAAHRADEIGEPLEREVFAVERDQHGVGGDERVERQQAERRRAVDEDVVVVVAHGAKQRAQPFFARAERDHFDLGAGEMTIGRNQFQVVDRGGDDERPRVGRRLDRRQRVVDGAGGRGETLLADAAGEVALRIDVDEQHAPLGDGEGGREVDGGGGFAHAALLVRDGYDPSHIRLYNQ